MRGEAPEGVMGLLAVSGKPTDIRWVGLGKALPSQRSHETSPVVDVLFYLLLGCGYRPGLEACYAVEPPREQRHALREGELQVPNRGEALQHTLAVPCQSWGSSRPGTTGAGERMPWRVAFHF